MRLLVARWWWLVSGRSHLVARWGSLVSGWGSLVSRWRGLVSRRWRVISGRRRRVDRGVLRAGARDAVRRRRLGTWLRRDITWVAHGSHCRPQFPRYLGNPGPLP